MTLMRQILVEALTHEAERYQRAGRDLIAWDARKPGRGLDSQAREKFALATYAILIRDELKEGSHELS